MQQDSLGAELIREGFVEGGFGARQDIERQEGHIASRVAETASNSGSRAHAYVICVLGLVCSMHYV